MNEAKLAFEKGLKEGIRKTANEEPSPAMQQLQNAGNPFSEGTVGGMEGMLGYLAMPAFGKLGQAALTTAIEPYMANESIELHEPGYNIEMME